MSKIFSIEFCLTFAMTFALFLIDKAGKSSVLLNAIFLFFITAFLLHPVMSIPWIWSPPEAAMRIWRAALMVCLVVFPVAWLGIWTWPRPIPTPIHFGAIFSSVEHIPDDEIAGIKWQNAYSELTVTIINGSSDIFYEDLDIRLKPDLFVAKIGCLARTGNPEVSFEPATPLSVSDPRAEGIHGMQLLATDVGYRMLCSRLPPNGHLMIVFAVVTVAQNKNPYPCGFEDFTMGFDVRDPKGEGGYMVWGYPTADIYSARPMNEPSEVCVAVDRVFTAAQRKHKISEWICSQERK